MSLDLSDSITYLIDLLVRRLNYAMPQLLDAFAFMLKNVAMALPSMINGLGEITDTILNGLTEMLPQILPLAEKILTTLVQGLQIALPQLANFAITLFGAISDFIQDNLPELVQCAVDIINTLCSQLLTSGNITLLIDSALAIIQALAENLLSADNIVLLLDAALQIIDALVNGIVDNVDDLLLGVETIITTIADMLTNPDKIAEIVAIGVKILTTLIVGLCQVTGELLGFAACLYDELKDTLGDIKWGEIGLQIVEGILSGFLDVDFSFSDYFSEFGDNFVTGIKDIFGIHSPSKLMRDEIGKFLLPGIAVGVEDTTGDTAKTINQQLDEMLNGIDMNALQMQLDSAVQMQGYASIMPSDLQQDLQETDDNAETDASHLSTPENMQINPKFAIYIGDTELKNYVITAIDEANAVSGGVSV